MSFSTEKVFFRIIVGFSAVLISFLFFISNHNDKVIFFASLFFIVACAWDCIKAKIPNFLNMGLALAGLILFFLSNGWIGVLTSLAGLSLGIILLIIPWRMGGMGAGDVKALGALGALLGPSQIVHVFIYMGLIGGVMAILHYAFERNLTAKTSEWFYALMTSALTKDPRLLIPETTQVSRFPYAVAIAFGYYSYLTFGSLF